MGGVVMDFSKEKIREEIYEIYERMLLLAYLNGANLKEILSEVVSEIKEFQISKDKNDWIPNGYEELWFINSMANKLNTTPAFFFIPNPNLKEKVVKELIERGKQSTDLMDIDFYDEDNPYSGVEINFIVKKRNRYCSNADFAKYEAELMGVSITGELASEDKITSLYSVMFRKCDDFYDIVLCYKRLFYMGEENDYFFSNMQIYSEKEGELSDFIENCIQKKVEEQVKNNKPKVSGIEIDRINEDKDEKTETAIKQGLGTMETFGRNLAQTNVDDRRGTELVVPVYDTSRTVDILDKYEGLNGKDDKPYERLVISNGNRVVMNYKYCIHYVIERSRKKDYVGDITFTEFKKGYTSELNQHVRKELENIDVNQYLDKDCFFRFNKPYHLRAQNSRNRTGYGWEWDWSGGYGDYTEGTLYGETTDYVIAGVYLSSDYTYNPKKRKASAKKISIQSAEKTIIQNINVAGYLNGTYKLVAKSGAMPKENSKKKKRIQLFIKVSRSGKDKYVPVVFDETEGNLYIDRKSFDYYRAQISRQKPVILYKTSMET